MGAYPELSLKGARDVTENARKLVKKGIHPAQQKKIDRIKSVHEQANAFEAIAKQGMASSLGLGRGHQEAHHSRRPRARAAAGRDRGRRGRHAT